MKRPAILLAFLLGGCATTGGVQVVNVPVPVECREPEPERPAWPTDALRPSVDADTFVKYAQAEIELREGYETKLLTALRNCTAPMKKGP